jgi:Raf kinase inhibitor-like YbhB/YbcL family protein
MERKMRVPACLVACLTLAALDTAQAAATVRITSGAIGSDGRIANAQSNYGANISPPLVWSPIAGARSYAIVLEDPDAGGPRPFVHWLVWNIPGTVTALAAGQVAPGAVQGRNDHDTIGYFGPRPPSGVHHYHLHIFALNAPLALAPGADRWALSAAMNDHVMAVGELVGTFAAP